MSISDTGQSTPPIAQSRDRLIQIVSERSLLRDTNVKLASGASSAFYFDMKRTAFHPEGANLMARLILHELADVDVDYVGGLEMGAVPLVASVIQQSSPTARSADFSSVSNRRTMTRAASSRDWVGRTPSPARQLCCPKTSRPPGARCSRRCLPCAPKARPCLRSSPSSIA